jgi:repressor of nif and glnA expression
LIKIREMKKERNLVGRKSLAEALQDTPYPLTEHQVRNRLNKLEEKSLIECKRGGHGTILSKRGKKYLRNKIME